MSICRGPLTQGCVWPQALTSVIERSTATTMMGLEKELKDAASSLEKYFKAFTRAPNNTENMFCQHQSGYLSLLRIVRLFYYLEIKYACYAGATRLPSL